MKKDRKRFKDALLEGLLEFVLSLVCFGLGALIVTLCGFGERIANMDFELIVLLGVAVTLVIFVAVYALVQRFKKTKKEGRKEHPEGENTGECENDR